MSSGTFTIVDYSSTTSSSSIVPILNLVGRHIQLGTAQVPVGLVTNFNLKLKVGTSHHCTLEEPQSKIRRLETLTSKVENDSEINST